METANLMPAERPVEEAPKTPKLEVVKNKKAPKKERAAKARPVEELETVPVKQMTDKEKENYIAHLTEKLTIAENKIEQYQLISDANFRQVRQAEENFAAMETFYKDRMAFIHNHAKTFYQAICLAAKGDTK